MSWKEYTTAGGSEIVDKLSAGLLQMGIGSGDNTLKEEIKSQ